MSPPSKEEPGLDVARFRIGDEELAVLGVPRATAAFDELTRAENEVCRLVLEGKSNATIAQLRGTSLNTVENQISAILLKLGVSSRFELAARGRRE